MQDVHITAAEHPRYLAQAVSALERFPSLLQLLQLL